MTIVDSIHNTATEDRLDAAIRESAEANSILAMFDASSVGLGFVDCDFRIIRINDALAAVNGGAVAGQIGRLVADVVPELWPQLEPMYQRVIDQNQPIANIQVTGMTAADSERKHHWLCSYYPVRSPKRSSDSESSRLTSPNGSRRSNNSTSHGLVRDGLRTSRNRRRDPRSRWRSFRVNAAVCALLGRPSEDLVGRRWTEYNHPDEVPLWQVCWRRSPATMTPTGTSVVTCDRKGASYGRRRMSPSFETRWGNRSTSWRTSST